MSMTPSLSGKVALVTGGGSGIGRATCQVLEREGANVIVTDINLASAKETLDILKNSERNLALAMDVLHKDTIEKVIAASFEKYKCPPILLVNGAGLCRRTDFLTMDMEDTSEIDVNVKGTMLVSQIIARAILDHGSEGGTIVNIASIVGRTGGESVIYYATTKGAVATLTKSIATQLARKGIRVNCVSPGLIDTPMLKSTGFDPMWIDSMTKKATALERKGKPEEVAEVIAFLLSERSSYVVGACIEVNGGIK